MKEQNIPESIYNLMSTYLSGNATDDQVLMLEDWVSENDANKAAFVEFKKVWMLSNISQPAKGIDVNKEWERLKSQTSSGKVVPIGQPKQARRWMSIAAGLAILVAGSLWMFNSLSADPTIAYTTEESPKIETLSDGSKVHLNQGTELYYNAPETETGTRNAQLNGDAFFDIKRDEAHPFEILADGMRITVLGTSFYIDARHGESTAQVIVNSGKVSVKSYGKEVILEKGESATLTKADQSLVKSINSNDNYLGWTNNTLSFKSTSLKDVVYDLNRHYHANISIENEALNNCKITAEYKDKTLQAIIKIIEATLGIEAEISGKSILLKGSDC